MKRHLFPSLILLFGSAAGAADLSDADKTRAHDMAKNNGCLSCHALTEKIVGPAYSNVAEKYKGQADAAAGLVQSIQYGSKGKWGRIPMPPHASISQEDLSLLARWVLTVQK